MRPLPRKRVERFVWQWPDTAWMLAILTVCALATPRDPRRLHEAAGIVLLAATSAAAYVAGLRMHSRVAAVSAAALIATSRQFAALCVGHPSSGMVACAVIVAVAGYGAGWMLLTYVAACAAFTLGFNGALVGLVVSVVPLVQKRENAAAGLIGYVAFAALWSLAVSRLHMPDGLRPWASWRGAASLGGIALFVAWFMAPFYAEATLKGARERWLMALALVATVAVMTFTSTTPVAPQLYVAFPIAMLVVAVGLGRLMPTIAGEYPTPTRRYAAATLAVLATLALRLWLDPRGSLGFIAAPLPAVSNPTGLPHNPDASTKMRVVPSQNAGPHEGNSARRGK